MHPSSVRNFPHPPQTKSLHTSKDVAHTRHDEGATANNFDYDCTLAVDARSGYGRASSNDLYVVQQLINDSVSLLVYSGSEGEEEGEESDGSSSLAGGGDGGSVGSSSGGGGRRRGRGDSLGGSHGAVCVGRSVTERSRR